MWVRTLSTIECTKLVEAGRLAYLACSKDDRPYLVPIYYAFDKAVLYAFTMPGKKLDLVRANPRVALLIEQRSAANEWRSVVVEGRFEELPDRLGHKVQRDRAWALLSRHSNWWEPGSLKPYPEKLSDHSPHVFFRIVIDQISGREGRER